MREGEGCDFVKKMVLMTSESTRKEEEHEYEDSPVKISSLLTQEDQCQSKLAKQMQAEKYMIC